MISYLTRGLATALFSTLILSGSALAENVTIRFATLQSPRHILSLELEKAFKEVAEKTDGRVRFQVHYGTESGFDSKQYVSALQYGMLDGALIPTSGTSLEYPWLGAYGLPFVAPSDETRSAMFAATVPMLQEFAAEHAFVPLAYPLHPDRWLVIYTDFKVETVADFAGRLIRTYDPNTNAIVSALGAVPTSLPKSEIYMALQRGTVDGAITGITALEEMKLNEVVDNVYQLDLMFLPHILGVSNKVWERIDPADQEITRTVFAKWDENYRAWLADPERSGDPYEYAKASGTNVILPDETAKAVFAKIHDDAVRAFTTGDEKSRKIFALMNEAAAAKPAE